MDSTAVLRPGRFSDRFVAYLVDTVPFAALAVFGVWVWAGPMRRPPSNDALTGIGAGAVALAVVWQFVGNLTGGTLGKKLLGLAVVTADGSAPGAGRALVRALAWLVSTPLGNFGFVVALFNSRTRTLHDYLSGTFVVEAGPRRSNGALAFVVAAACAIALFASQYMSAILRPTTEDLAAIARAREGLEIVAKIQESYKATHGTYTDSVQDLAEASGNVEVFRAAMLEVFSPTPFYLQAGNVRWRVTAAAKDRRRTRVTFVGP